MPKFFRKNFRGLGDFVKFRCYVRCSECPSQLFHCAEDVFQGEQSARVELAHLKEGEELGVPEHDDLDCEGKRTLPDGVDEHLELEAGRQGEHAGIELPKPVGDCGLERSVRHAPFQRVKV